MKHSIDLTDIINKNYLNLWERYKPLQMVYYKKLSLYIRHDLYEFGFDEFRQDCAVVLINAANGVKVEKIKNPETYSFYVQYSQYLQNFTSRNITRDYCHNYAIRYMDYNESPEGESDFEWDSILAIEDHHSNTWNLVDTLPDKYIEKAVKIAWHLPRGGANSDKWPEEVKKLFKDYYSEY